MSLNISIESLLARSDIRMAVTDKSSKFHELEQEFKSAVESQYIMRDELGRLRQDVLATEQRLQQSKEGQDNLLSILSKLKLKAETHKIRATGAVCVERPGRFYISLGNSSSQY
jgi:hypothetical protein